VPTESCSTIFASDKAPDMTRTATTLGAALLLAIAMAASCTRSSAGNNQSIIVGGKAFSEQRLLATIVQLQLERQLGTGVATRIFESTAEIDRALNAGEVGLYPEYTGTALTAILHQKVASDPRAVYTEVVRRYQEKGLEWFNPLGFQNTFAIVVRGEDARRHSLHTLSDAAKLQNPWRFGMGAEFRERPDGFKGLSERYGLKTAPVLTVLQMDRLFRELDDHNVDMIAANSTDGLLAALDVVALVDDKHYFPPYEAAIVARRDVLDAHRGLREALRELDGRFPLDTMRRLNYEVDVRHRPERDVANEFLTQMTKERTR
jgi:osmoprotectant transport system substrate-binding protein